MAELPLAVVAHPIGNKHPDAVTELGARAADEVAAIMLGRNPGYAGPPPAPRATAPNRPAARVTASADDLALFEDFLERGWSEGLPIIAPTVERIERALRFVGRPPDEVIGVIAPRRGIATVEAVLANAIMAGCRDDLIPLVLAAVEGVCRPRHNIYGVQATTGSVAPMTVVFGPGATRLGVHGGTGCLSPGFRANATVGRALRLVLWNVGGGRPGGLDRATQGQPGKYGLCLAENTAESPWPSWHEENGFAPDETAVFVTGAEGTEDLIDYSSQNAHDLVQLIQSSFLSLSANHMLYGGWSTILLCPEHAEMFADEGMSRADAVAMLVDGAEVPYSAFPPASQVTLRRKRPNLFEPSGHAPQMIPAFDTPQHLQLIVAGGAGPHSVFVPGYGDLTDPQWVHVREPGTK